MLSALAYYGIGAKSPPTAHAAIHLEGDKLVYVDKLQREEYTYAACIALHAAIDAGAAAANTVPNVKPAPA